ncbi:HAD family hydrolase [Paracoccus xiamenensis]|uniref:HAD family hydrolase n=1 Tax=Paracoccus xiamenensis TaxID=2714901 RepID=UPI00140D2DD5|nr:HAD family phosphatase [Paracoccus xiamenensis]NHF72275.1 HAD family phosphatase [Paracoccus xiamenensis]
MSKSHAIGLRGLYAPDPGSSSSPAFPLPVKWGLSGHIPSEPDKMMKRAILWDMDGTLIDSEPAHGAAFDKSVAELGLTFPADFHDRLLGSSSVEVHAAVAEKAGPDFTYDDWMGLKWGHFVDQIAKVQRRKSLADIAEAKAAQGLPMAVVSNSTADEVAIGMKVTGLDKIIPVTVSRADVEAGKPSPEGYRLAAARLGVPPEDCLVVEDSLVGAQAGLNAGMRVLYHPQHAARDPGSLPPGLRYLPPDADPAPVIEEMLR